MALNWLAFNFEIVWLFEGDWFARGSGGPGDAPDRGILEEVAEEEVCPEAPGRLRVRPQLRSSHEQTLLPQNYLTITLFGSRLLS